MFMYVNKCIKVKEGEESKIYRVYRYVNVRIMYQERLRLRQRQ